MMANKMTKKFEALDIHEAEKELETSIGNGLSEADAEQRRDCKVEG